MHDKEKDFLGGPFFDTEILQEKRDSNRVVIFSLHFQFFLKR